MANKTYHGSCQCKRVTYEATFDLAAGTNKCNCTFCWKKRWWTVSVKPENFRSLSGETELSKYQPGQKDGHGGFCKHCGVQPYVYIPKMEWNEAAYVSLNVAAFDDLDPGELAAAPVTYLDGRADNWWNPPAETRHL